MDRSVKPGDDFYRYANGKWDDRTAIPSDRTRYGNFDKLTELSENRVRAIVDEASAGKLKDPDAAKIGAVYGALHGRGPGREAGRQADRAGAGDDPRDQQQGRLHRPDGQVQHHRLRLDPAIGISIDAKSPTKYAVLTGTGGMGLPDRDYYLQASFAEKKAKYLAYVEQMLAMAGWEDPAANAKAVVDFETRLAEASWDPGAAPRPRQDLQPDEPGRAQRLHARLRLEPLPGGRRPGRRATDHRHHQHRLPPPSPRSTPRLRYRR